MRIITAIKLGGKTIGVIAGGFDHLISKGKYTIAQEMMKNQLVISEYPPDTKPTKMAFSNA